jgi:hypothetical protein
MFTRFRPRPTQLHQQVAVVVESQPVPAEPERYPKRRIDERKPSQEGFGFTRQR